MSDFLWPHGLEPSRLLCPWDSSGKNTGVGCHFLLQGIFPTQGLNPGLPYYRHTLYGLSHQGRQTLRSPLRSSANTTVSPSQPHKEVWSSGLSQCPISLSIFISWVLIVPKALSLLHFCFESLPLNLLYSRVARYNTGCSVKIEFQINKESICSV